MKQLKKTLLTLVALLAVTAGAWADETPLLTIEGIDNEDFTSGSKTFDDKVTVTFSNSVSNLGNDDGWYIWGGSLLTVAGINGYTITSCKFYTKNADAATGYTVEGESPSVYLSGYSVYTDASLADEIGEPGITKIEVYGTAPSASGPDVTWTAASKTGTFTMPGGNVTLEPDYYPQATAAEGAVTAATDAKATTDAPLVTIDETKLTGVKKLMYYVSTDATAPAYDADGWTDVLPTAENYTQAATLNVWYYPVGTDEGIDEATATYSDGDICSTALTVSLGAAPTYAVTFADDLTEPDKWTASPATGVVKGTEVTVNYTGSKKVIGVKAEKKAAAASNSVDLSTLTENTELKDGDVLTGTLPGNYKITIADGATVTLSGAVINGTSNNSYSWAGLTLAGDGTIILSGENTVKGFHEMYPGIFVPENKTLTIQGDGSLTASSNGFGAGIGCGYGIACGNITIEGGTVTATGGRRAAGIGGGSSASCGNISITGGTVTATGGQMAAGIGGGRSASCGDITIANTVTKVTATKGDNATNSIGAGLSGTCGTVTIGGNVGAITTSPYTYQPSN